MTSLVAWAGVDSRGTTSVYVASDSRISWGTDGWNSGRKVFASRSHPEIFGYCGDVVFPSLFLAQAIDLIDAGLLSTADDPDQVAGRVSSLAQNAFATYPQDQRNPFVIIHCFRRLENMRARFYAYSYEWSGSSWRCSSLTIPSRSDVIGVWGSGSDAVKKWHELWSGTKQGRTSRAVFGAFCDSLDSSEDQFSGGAPQLVAIHRSYPAKTYGIIWKGKRFLLGIPADDVVQSGKVDWRNALLERCDGETMAVLPDAQRHLRPKEFDK